MPGLSLFLLYACANITTCMYTMAHAEDILNPDGQIIIVCRYVPP